MALGWRAIDQGDQSRLHFAVHLSFIHTIPFLVMKGGFQSPSALCIKLQLTEYSDLGNLWNVKSDQESIFSEIVLKTKL